MTRLKPPLPKGFRWTWNRGTIYYQVPKGSEHLWDGKRLFRLGKTLNEAWRTWLERVEPIPDKPIRTMNDLLDDFWLRYVQAHLAPSTAETYKFHIIPLRKAFGHMPPEDVTLQDAFEYRAARQAQEKPVAANREVSVLSSALQHGVEIGALPMNPLRGQVSRRRGAAKESPRKRAPTSAELEAFTQEAPDLAGWILLKRITGLRQGQMLQINLTRHWDRKKKELHPPTSKGGKDTIYYGEALELAIREILKGEFPRGPLFRNRRGDPLTATALKSRWSRAMKRYVAAGGERFNEHDIRKYVANHAETLEHAQRLLGHNEVKTTARVYRTNPERAEVLK